MNIRLVQYGWNIPNGFWPRLGMIAAGVIVFALALLFTSVLFIAGAIALTTGFAIATLRRRFGRNHSPLETVADAHIDAHAIEGQYEVLEDSKEERPQHHAHSAH